MVSEEMKKSVKLVGVEITMLAKRKNKKSKKVQPEF